MTKKRILVWETLGTIFGGQKMTLTILDMLKDQYEFCCLVPKEGLLSKELKKRNIQYVIMGDQSLPTGVKSKLIIFRYGWMSLKNIFKSLKIIRKFKPDILYCPGPAALPWSAICGSLSRKPVVWHLHHVFLDGATKKLLNICGKFKSVKKIIAVSNCVGQQIKNVAKEKVAVLYNPVDVLKYANGNSEEANVPNYDAKQLKEKLVIGHVALIQESKKQLFVLNVIKALKDKNKDVLGLFIGDVREEEYYLELKDKVKEYDLENEVLFLGRRDDVPNLLKVINVLLIPSFEGLPLAGLEASAAGVPVCACDVGGAQELSQVSGNGLCFKEDDVNDALKTIEEILNNKEEIIEKGKAFVMEMTNENYMKAIEDLFKGIIND